MKVLFLHRQTENLGIQFLSSHLKRLGHQTELSFDPSIFNDSYFNFPWLYKRFGFQSRVDATINRFKPDIVGFSCTTGSYLWALEQARWIKRQHDLPVVFGGVHPTLVPEVVISEPSVDYVIVGEGEQPLAELLDHLHDPKKFDSIQNLWWKEKGAIHNNSLRPLIRNLDEYPQPDKELFYCQSPVMSGQYRTISARGCPSSCAYCYESAIKRIYPDERCTPRQRSADRLIQELEEAKRRYLIKLVVFCDEDFLYRRDLEEDFLPKYRARVGLPFRCQTSPINITAEKARALKQAGCVDVVVGVETLNEETRKRMLNRPGSNKKIIEAIKLLQEAGLRVQVDHIIGIPGETSEEQRKALGVYNELRPILVNLFWLRYFPMTEMTLQAEKKGLLSKKEIDEINRGVGLTYVQGGSVRNFKKLRQMALLFDGLSLFPEGFFRWILDRRLDRFLPRSRVLQVLFRSVSSLIHHDYLFGLFTKNYFYWIRQRLRGKHCTIPRSDRGQARA